MKDTFASETRAENTFFALYFFYVFRISRKIFSCVKQTAKKSSVTLLGPIILINA